MGESKSKPFIPKKSEQSRVCWGSDSILFYKRTAITIIIFTVTVWDACKFVTRELFGMGVTITPHPYKVGFDEKFFYLIHTVLCNHASSQIIFNRPPLIRTNSLYGSKIADIFIVEYQILVAIYSWHAQILVKNVGNNAH